MKNNNYIWHTPCLRNSIAYDHDFWCVYMCKIMISQAFFSFFWNFYFLGCYRGKRAKKHSPKWKLTIISITFTCYISETVFFFFLVHFCKMMISLGVFSFLWNFNFLGDNCQGGKRAKNRLKWKITFIYIFTHHISGTI